MRKDSKLVAEQRNQKSEYNLDAIMYNINHTPIKMLNPEEQEWLGIFHSAETVETMLMNHPEAYSDRKRTIIRDFLNDIEQMRNQFDQFYNDYLRKD